MVLHNFSVNCKHRASTLLTYETLSSHHRNTRAKRMINFYLTINHLQKVI